MPLTALQKQVLQILAANRSEESHFAGGVVLNAPDESPRSSHDFDIFHEAEAEVARASDLDMASLRAARYEVHEAGADLLTERLLWLGASARAFAGLFIEERARRVGVADLRRNSRARRRVRSAGRDQSEEAADSAASNHFHTGIQRTG